MQCQHLRKDICMIATQLARCGVRPHPSACRWCTEQTVPPQSLNRVTVSLALQAADDDIKQQLLAAHGQLFGMGDSEPNARLVAITRGSGVGSQLWRLLESLGVRHTSTCSCIALAQQLNDWGHAGCRLARAEIVERMRNNAQTYGWGTIAKAAGLAIVTGVAWKINPLDPYGSLLDEAIRRAAAASVP
jgi:hypothetical protein